MNHPFLSGLIAAGILVSGCATQDTTASGSDDWSTYHDHDYGLSISFPPSWNAVAATLVPVQHDPLLPIAIGTFPLEPNRSEDCGPIPERALNALSPTDAFIGVYIYRGFASFGATNERPDRFTPDLFPPGQKIKCTEKVRGTVGMFAFNDRGAKLNLVVAIGSEASPARQAEVYRILDTLTVDDHVTR